jgi:hypothetical protein
MRKSCIIGLLFLAICLSSCGEEPLEHHTPGYDWRIDRSQFFDQYYARNSAMDPCPTSGNNCHKRPPKESTLEPALAAFSAFKTYYDGDSTDVFFQLPQNELAWEMLFPALPYDTDIVQLLAAGTYKTHLFADSTIVIYSGSFSDTANMLLHFAVIPNLNGPQEED